MALLCPILFTCCSAEPDSEDNTILMPAAAHKSANHAGNTDNPFRYAGTSYGELLHQYRLADYNPASFSEVAQIVSDLMGERADTIDITTQNMLLGILSDQDVAFTALLQNSNLSAHARTVLSEFIQIYDSLLPQDYPTSLEEILSFEKGIMVSTALADEEKRVILTITSIACSCLKCKQEEDPDWDTSVGNIIAASAGALQNVDLAIQYGLIVKIALHENINF